MIDDGGGHLLGRRDVVRGGVDVELVALGQHLAGQRVDLGDALDLVAEELDARPRSRRTPAEARACRRGRGSARATAAASLRWYCRSTSWRSTPVAPVAPAHPQAHDRGAVVDRRAQAVDARHRRDDDRVAPLEECPRRRVAQLVDLVVARRILLDVRVRARQVRLGLVVVEVRDEVLDRVVREELAELGVQLRRQRLVVAQHQRRPLGLLDDVGDGVALARAGDAQQRLELGCPWPGRRRACRWPAAGRPSVGTGPRA